MHQSPYEEGPLADCERLVPATPAPIPGYFIAVLYPLALLPLSVATWLWELLLLASIACAVWLVSKLARCDDSAVVAAFALSLGMTSLVSGEMVPICVAALCAAAFFLRRQRYGICALFMTLAMIEPHVALPAWLAVLIFVRRARAALAAGAVVLAALSFAAIGPAENARYFVEVLPAHVRSELGVDFQYSLSTVLAFAPASVAIAAGELSYIFLAAFGLLVAWRLRSMSGDAAFLIVTPAAFALIGGPFIHLVQMAFAIPLVFLLTTLPGRWNALLIAVLLLLAVPWQDVLWAPTTVLAVLYPIAALTWFCTGGNVKAVAVSAVAALLVFAAILITKAPFHPGQLNAMPLARHDLAERAWAYGLSAIRGYQPLGAWIQRAPTWLGLAGLIFAAAQAAYSPKETALCLDAALDAPKGVDHFA